MPRGPADQTPDCRSDLSPPPHPTPPHGSIQSTAGPGQPTTCEPTSLLDSRVKILSRDTMKVAAGNALHFGRKAAPALAQPSALSPQGPSMSYAVLPYFGPAVVWLRCSCFQMERQTSANAVPLSKANSLWSTPLNPLAPTHPSPLGWRCPSALSD